MAKFDWVPYLEGKYLSYYEWFALIGSFTCLMISILNLVVYLILSKIGVHQKNYAFLSWTNSKKPVIQKLKSITFNAAFIFLSLIPLICQALDVIYLITGIFGQAAILILGIYLDNGRKQWKDDTDLFTNNLKTIGRNYSLLKQYLLCCLKLTKNSKKKIIICLSVTLIANLFMYKTCLCFYNSQISYYNQALGFGINTCLTRFFQLKPSCPPGAPCQMYTTIPENPHQAIFLNLHTHIDVKSVDVYYQELLTQNVTDFKNVTAELFPYEGLESIAQRNVHSVLLNGLKPNTKYLTKVFYNNRFWTNAIFKTLPAPGDKKTPIRMINAGDSGYNEAAVNLSKLVATMKPDIFFMGGDIAYDDNMPACAYTWDYFFGMYGRITATLGYLMPIVATVGNHDVGLNQLPGVNITVSNKGPAFHLYLPQHFQRNLDGHIIEKVPALSKRRTMFNFTFGNVHYLALDSGYMHGFDGYQKKFMIDSFQANRDKIKFVNYHVPIYSVCQAFDKDPTRFLYALFHWVPNFDKYHVMASFENHVHSFKRTKPLVGSTPAQFGTVYLGDGAYGAIIAQMCKPDVTMDIFEAYSRKNNFWLTQITEKKVQHWAYDSEGELIDHFIQYPQNYTMGTQRLSMDDKEKKIRASQGEERVEQNMGKEKYEISMQDAKKIAEQYYRKDEERKITEEKLPVRQQKERRERAQKEGREMQQHERKERDENERLVKAKQLELKGKEEALKLEEDELKAKQQKLQTSVFELKEREEQLRKREVQVQKRQQSERIKEEELQKRIKEQQVQQRIQEQEVQKRIKEQQTQEQQQHQKQNKQKQMFAQAQKTLKPTEKHADKDDDKLNIIKQEEVIMVEN